jgi:hypothetical protein
MKPKRAASPSGEAAMVSLAVALIITLIAFMAALPPRRATRCPSSAPCEASEGPCPYSLPVVVVAVASRFDNAAAVGIGVEQAPFAQR